MKIPVYAEHDGQAYNAFTKTTSAEIIPTRAGISARIQRVTLRKITSSRGYSADTLPANLATLEAAQVIEIISKPYLYQGQELPLYNLHSTAYKWAVKLNLIEEEK